MRFQSLDGLRGVFLILMMQSHIMVVAGATLGKISHHDLSWADAASGFVFMSGLVVGLVYGGRLIRHGEARMSQDLLSRIGTIYRHHVLLVLVLLGLALLALWQGMTVKQLQPFLREPILASGLGLLLSADIDFLDILPMYVVFMLATPFVLRSLNRGRTAEVMLGSFALWLLAQSGLSAAPVDWVETFLQVRGHDVQVGLYFNLLGWQLLFVGGLVAGYMTADGKNPAPRLLRPGQEGLVFTALAIIIALMILKALFRLEVIGADYGTLPHDLGSKSRLGLIFLASFLLNTFVISWLLVAGSNSNVRNLRGPAQALSRVLTWRPLVFLGQHSLHAFSAHVLFIYLLAFSLGGQRPDPWLSNLIWLLSPAPMYLAAWLQSGARMRKPQTA